MKNILNKVFLILAILWLIISSYLTYAHYNIDIETAQNFCSVWWTLNFLEQNNPTKSSCASVLQSDYSEFFWIPTSILWIIFYVSIIFLFILKIRKKENNYIKNILSVFIIIWFLESAYFTYLQFFVIDWFCIYCFSSAVIVTILLLLDIYFRLQKKN